MAHAMMKQTMLNVNLTVEIAVGLVSTQSIVHNVFVIMKQNQYLMFHVSSFLFRIIIINLISIETIISHCLFAYAELFL